MKKEQRLLRLENTESDYEQTGLKINQHFEVVSSMTPSMVLTAEIFHSLLLFLLPRPVDRRFLCETYNAIMSFACCVIRL